MGILSGKFDHRRSASYFAWLGLFFAIAFWMLDSLIDIIFFTGETYSKSLMPSGMELYMRLLVSFLLLVFGLIVAMLVEENNRLSEYLESISQKEQKYYRALFSFAPIAIIILDANLRIVKWNKEAAQIFGWDQSDVVSMSIFNFVVPVNAQENIASTQDMFMGKGNLIGLNMTEAGSNPLWNWHFAPVKDDSGNLLNVILMGEGMRNKSPYGSDLTGTESSFRPYPSIQ